MNPTLILTPNLNLSATLSASLGADFGIIVALSAVIKCHK